MPQHPGPGLLRVHGAARAGLSVPAPQRERRGHRPAFPSVALPSILGALVAFGVVIGPAYALAMEREDGTLLRAKAVPHGHGRLLHRPAAAPLAGPALAVCDPACPASCSSTTLMAGAVRLARRGLGAASSGCWPRCRSAWSSARSCPARRRSARWGMLPIMVLAGISGIFYPIQRCGAGCRCVAQVFPMYWLGLGMRSAFLPDAAAALEIGGTWRTLETVARARRVGRRRPARRRRSCCAGWPGGSPVPRSRPPREQALQWV